MSNCVGPTALLEALSGCTRVLLTGPVAPDGDSIGACLALQRLLVRRGVAVDVAGVPAYRYRWMPGALQMLPDSVLEPVYDGVVVLDGDRHRLTPPAATCFQAARVRGIVDHHASTRLDGYTHPWVEHGATSTCEMVFDALVTDDMLDRELAELLYVGAIFDTGGFCYSNTTATTHRMAARLLEVGIEHAPICTRVLLERRQSGLRLAGAVFGSAEFYAEGALAVGCIRSSSPPASTSSTATSTASWTRWCTRRASRSRPCSSSAAPSA